MASKEKLWQAVAALSTDDPNIALWIGAAVCLGLLLVFGVAFYMSNESAKANTAGHTVISHDQRGGITAHQVNIDNEDKEPREGETFSFPIKGGKADGA